MATKPASMPANAAQTAAPSYRLAARDQEFILGDSMRGLRGASDAGAPSIGFNIALPHEQEPNAFSTPELTFRFHYFAMRKMHLAMRQRARGVPRRLRHAR
jgi:hypothetical protein